MQSGTQAFIQRRMQEPSPLQGFDNQQDSLPKQQSKRSESHPYFQLPQAKPILSKQYIDYAQAKVLIRHVRITRESQQLLNAKVAPLAVAEKSQGGHHARLGEGTLWQKFMQGKQFRCVYVKYLSGSSEQLMALSQRKLRVELQKLTQNNQALFATLVVDMNFLTEVGTHALATLTSHSLQEDEAYLHSLPAGSIEFDSRFQCGNLMYVFTQEGEEGKQYFLVLQNDVNTRGYANWFYFRLFIKGQTKIRLHLVNLQKHFSYFSCGMRPMVHSLRGKSWKQAGNNLSYHRNQLQQAEEPPTLSTFSFTLQQPHDSDVLHIAANLPYSYSKLMAFIDEIEKNAKSNSSLYYRRQILALTVSSNECPLITITAKRDKKRQQTGRKKIVLVLARQHPSEVVSSYVMQGLLQQLLSSREATHDLLHRFIFKIVPIVNVDGVIYGNSRCQISGCDGNRKWSRNPNTFLYPVIAAIRKLSANLLNEGYEIAYFIDLHGHSRKLGTFIYACKGQDEVQTRVFAFIMSKINSKFNFEDCRFGLSNFRRETARGCMDGLLGNGRSMTLQTSFYGYRVGQNVKCFQLADLRDIGSSLMEAIHIDTFKNSKIINWNSIKTQLKNSLARNPPHSEDQVSSGSDSQPQADQLTPEERNNLFLSTAAASKLGLHDLKVFDRSRRIEQKKYREKGQQEELEQEEGLGSMSINRNQDLMSHRYSQSQTLLPHDKSIIKQNKSVTKVQPFKFKTRKSLSLSKKIRIAIDVQRSDTKQQKLSSPTLPKVHPKDSKQFWNHFKQQYLSLINQKERIIKQTLPPAIRSTQLPRRP